MTAPMGHPDDLEHGADGCGMSHAVALVVGLVLGASLTLIAMALGPLILRDRHRVPPPMHRSRQ